MYQSSVASGYTYQSSVGSAIQARSKSYGSEFSNVSSSNDQELAVLYLQKAIAIMNDGPGPAGGVAGGRSGQLPMQVIQKLKKEPAAGRYGRTDVLDQTERQEMLYSISEENVSLKKTNQKLADQVKQLGVRFGQIQKEMMREGYFGGASSGSGVQPSAVSGSLREVEKLQRALQETGGFTGTSSSSTAAPFTPGGRKTAPEASSLSKQSRRAVLGGGSSGVGGGGRTGGLRHRVASLSPSGGGGVVASSRSPEGRGVTRMLAEEAESLRRELKDIKEKNERLSTQMDGVMSAREGKQGSNAYADAFYKEQIGDRDSKVNQLHKQLLDERENAAAKQKHLADKIAEAEKEKIAVEADLRHALALSDETENAGLQRKLKETDEMNRRLMEKLNKLTTNAFISTADTRVASAKRLEILEKDLVETQKALAKVEAEKADNLAAVEAAKSTQKEAEEKYHVLFESSERVRIQLEEKEKAAKRVEEQLRLLRESLPEEERLNVEKSRDRSTSFWIEFG